MAKKIQNNLLNELPLAAALEGEVKAWADQGWGQGTTQTTQDLLSYWFNRGEETDEKFHDCQRRAVETIIYCHEVLGIETLKQAFERFAPEALAASATLSEEVRSLPFAKYCLKMATGTGKTWVLAALLVWQYFNALNGERSGKYSTHFLLVAPGHEVLNRLLDMFKGKHDAKTGQREKVKSDLMRPLFMPEGERFRNRFNLQILEPADIRPNFTPPDEPFVYITNWQQFRLNESSNLWDQLTGADVEEQPRGEIIADFLSEYSDLIIFNDEAHHVHGAKTAKGEELVWRKFLTVLYNRMAEKRGGEKGAFLQIDFSATPFYGSAEKKEYFPHIVYDFDLVKAMRAMLVKQIFLEERQGMMGEKMDDLDVRAERAEADSEHRRGQVIGVSVSQKLLLDIGRKKTEQIAMEFREKGLDKKPVLFVLAENTEVADLVAEHLANLTDERGRNYRNQILVIHSDKKGEMSDKDWEKYRQQLESLDEPEEINPIRVVVSVLMLREGFDTQNVAVVVVLRSAEQNLLLEQIVGRGVRLMFPEYKYPELSDLKREAREDVMNKRVPKNSLDFLFVVEHPEFRKFYDELQKQGYAIGIGDSSGTETTGDLVLSEATPERIKHYDLSWPIQVYEQSPKFDFSAIDVSKLPKYTTSFESLKKVLSTIAITSINAETGIKIKTWKLDNQYFDYAHFLRQATMAVASEKGAHILTGKMADITGIIDEYVSNYLFGGEIDFQKAENYTVLNYAPLFDFVVGSVKRVLLDGLGAIQYEVKAGKIGKLSDVKKIYVRESLSVPVERCIYPLSAYSRRGEGFEKKFMEETLDKSGEVEAFGKIQQRKHLLNISYRDKDGIKRDYFPDFIIKTKDKMYIVETKAEDEIQKAEGNEKNLIVLKARAAVSWCKTASQVALPDQPQDWEYFMLSEKTFKENRQLGFDSLTGLGRLDLERLLSSEAGKLF
ncbi:MAG TPA: DEAD/DEAH box helicase family protein [Patescibacteria group bacterium]|nr:DEAD/DEAH box helicase family protein [Patescibacteria group bacterium]